MSSLQRRVEAFTDRLTAITETTVNLKAQFWTPPDIAGTGTLSKHRPSRQPDLVRAHQRRRATATPNRNATNSEPSGASRATLLKILNGIPGFRPASIAPLTLWTVPFTASETSAMVDFGSGMGPNPSWAKGASGMLSLTIESPNQQTANKSKA